MNIHQCYMLKPSRIALGFQLLSLLGILVLLSFLLNIWMCSLLLIIGLCSLYVFRQKPKVACLEQLDQQDWSLKFTDTETIQHVQVKQIFDHSVYVVIHFHGKKYQNLVLWCDQLSKEQWKSVKARAKLN